MKIKTALLLTTIFLLFQNAFAQNNSIKIECVLEINQTVWLDNSKITAKLNLKNSSARKVKLKLPPSFNLESLDPKFKDPMEKVGAEYGAWEIEYLTMTENNKIVEVYGNGKPQYFKFSLEPGESKIIEFDVSRLGWKDGFSSIWIVKKRRAAVPNGDYNLYYEWGYAVDEKDKSKGSVSIISNKIPVKLTSKK